MLLPRKYILALCLLSLTLTIPYLFYMTDKNSVVMMESDDQQDIIQTTKYVANTGTRMNLTRQEWENCLHEGQAAEFYLSIVLVTRMDDYAGYEVVLSILFTHCPFCVAINITDFKTLLTALIYLLNIPNKRSNYSSSSGTHRLAKEECWMPL